MDIGRFVRNLITAIILVILFYGVMLAAGFMTSLVGALLTVGFSIFCAYIVVRMCNQKKYQ